MPGTPCAVPEVVAVTVDELQAEVELLRAENTVLRERTVNADQERRLEELKRRTTA